MLILSVSACVVFLVGMALAANLCSIPLRSDQPAVLIILISLFLSTAALVLLTTYCFKKQENERKKLL